MQIVCRQERRFSDWQIEFTCKKWYEINKINFFAFFRKLVMSAWRGDMKHGMTMLRAPLTACTRALCTIFVRSMLFVCVLLFCACTDSPLDSDKPVTLTMWHVYGAQAHSPMNMLIDRFNKTVGKEQGIIINVTSVSSTWTIHDELVASAREDPGSEELPDLFTCYPKTLAIIGTSRVLNWKKFFSEEELKNYVPAFLEEGMLNDALYGFPFAKSTNLLYVNDTLFEPFSQETGISHSDLATLDGVFRAAARYHEWSGGKSFFMYDDWIHYAILNSESLGEPFFEGEHIRWDNPALLKAWRPLARAAANGQLWLNPGYNSTVMMMGEVVCGVGSSAAVLYFNDTLTLRDNTTLPLRLTILPDPRFEGAKRLDIQRGSSLYARASTPKKEYAAAVFCKWITSPEINLSLATQGGYMPVHKEAFQKLMQAGYVNFPNERYQQAYKVLLSLYETSTFIPVPDFERYGELEKRFGVALRDVLSSYRGTWCGIGGNSEKVVRTTFSELKKQLTMPF